MTNEEKEIEKRKLESIFMKLCEQGELEKIKQFLKDYPETDISIGENYGLTYAAKNNHFDLVVYLIENTVMGQDRRIYNEQGAYQVACVYNKENTVDYLFKHWKKNQHLKESAWEWGYSCSFAYEHKNLMEYFLTNPEAIEFKNQSEIEESFISFYKTENKDLLQYLIFDYNIEYSAKIKELLEIDTTEKNGFNKKNKIPKTEILEWFKKQELKNKLDENYPEKNNFIKSRKI